MSLCVTVQKVRENYIRNGAQSTGSRQSDEMANKGGQFVLGQNVHEGAVEADALAVAHQDTASGRLRAGLRAVFVNLQKIEYGNKDNKDDQRRDISLVVYRKIKDWKTRLF